MEDSNFSDRDSKPVMSDQKREREVFSLSAAFRNIPHIPLGNSPNTDSFPSDFVPKPASDAPLAAFAQLAAMRLHAQRSMISLLDGQYQYILAEATPKTSLRSNAPLHEDHDILIGSARIKRNWGICEKVLDPLALQEGDPGIIIINDLSKSPLFQNRSYIKDNPRFRFYAGVPLISQNGMIVGSICIFDGPERNGMSADDISCLQDLATTVMEYLVTYTIKDQHRRGAEGLHGLLSFSEGDTKLKAFQEYYVPSSPSQRSPHPTSNANDKMSSPTTDQDPFNRAHLIQPRLTEVLSERREIERRQSAHDLQKRMLPNTTRAIFSRAATILQKSSDMDGVMFVDASVAAIGLSGVDQTATQASEKQCQILGFAIGDKASLRNDEMPGNMIIYESNLMWLLKIYPNGYTLDCDDIDATSPNDKGAPFHVPFSPTATVETTDNAYQSSIERRAEHVRKIKALFPNIQSALFLPLWDFERNRWFASCFCWSTRAERNLSGPLELPFLKAFGHSIMQEVARSEAVNRSQTKTTFLSSLSHELRSPLHGILGSVQLMKTTPLDSFQATMVNSISVCGRTLLETVRHLLDHAERKDSGRNYSTKNFPKENIVRITSSPLPVNSSTDTSIASRFCNVGVVTEEIVETMFLGEARFDLSLVGEDIPGTSDHSPSSSEIARRRNRFIILDIGDFVRLDFCIAASSYGRLVMNLLGNALKFTESGYVLLWLRTSILDESRAIVTLKINDSGIGFDRDFLRNEAFEPFRKFNQHSAGTGVGLNVVKRIIEDVGGSIEISSEPGKGTDIELNLTLERYKRAADADSPHAALLASLVQLKGRKVCIFHSKPPDENATSDNQRHWEMLKQYIIALTSTLQVELKMIVTQISHWDGGDESDIVICPEVSFESLHGIRSTRRRKPPATLLIAMDTIEANTLRCDARVTSSDSVVEIISQPCGPFKLGMTLRHCLQRYDKTLISSTQNPTEPSKSTGTINGSSLITEPSPKLEIYSPTTFRLKNGSSAEGSIPAQDPDLQPPSAPTLDIHGAESTQSLQVLIVDDNAINRRLLSAFLKKRKITFKEACDGLQALNMYRETSVAFDVILMDISMPVMDGMTSTRLIREHENKSKRKPAHIIALTGLTSASAKLEAWSSGVDDFLTKPVDFKKMTTLMEAGRGGSGTGFLREQKGRVPSEKLDLEQS